MDSSHFSQLAPGELVPIEAGEAAYIPNALPAGIEMPPRLWPRHAEAESWLGRIRGLTQAGVVDPSVLLRPLQYREALRSSSQEGTFVEPEQLLLYEDKPAEPESEQDPRNAAREVLNLREALEIGETLVLERGYSEWLIRTLHQRLLDGVRGKDKKPGAYRESQVYIGWDKRFVPPPAYRVPGLMTNLVESILRPGRLPPLEHAFVVHYQFESIHPFLDGNGRLGRLLLSLMLGTTTSLGRPWLYLSPWFERHRDEYVNRMFRVSTNAEWEPWLEFCLQCVIDQARDTSMRFEAVIKLQRDWIARIGERRLKAGVLAILPRLLAGRLVSVGDAGQIMGVAYGTARKYLDQLEKIGIAKIEGEYPARAHSPEAQRIAFADDVSEFRVTHEDADDPR